MTPVHSMDRREDVRVLTLDDFQERPACPACGCPHTAIVGEQIRFREAERFPSGWVALSSAVAKERCLLKCSLCRLVYFSHVPSETTLKELMDRPEVVERWQPTDRPAFRYARDIVSQFLAGSGRILDVGAHTGGFLASLAQGWEKVALDPMANGGVGGGAITVVREFIENTTLPSATFDCVTAFDVLEHVRSPNAAMAQVARILKPGGLFIAETGDNQSIGARLLGPGWYYTNYLEHFQALATRSVRWLFDTCGLELVLCRKTRHQDPQWRGLPRSTVGCLAYTLLTLGRSPRLWLFLRRQLRRSGAAAPPDTGRMERDHIFVVGRKVTG